MSRYGIDNLSSCDTIVKNCITRRCVSLERTERDIIYAFNRLLSKMPVAKITTKMITDEAMIGRATFYRHFKDKYDVLNRNYKILLDSCLQNCNNYRDLFYELYCYARDEWSVFHRAFMTTGVNSFENYVFQYSRSVVEEITRQNRNGEGLTVPESMQLDVFCYGITYMYRKWTMNQYALDPDTAADSLYKIMPETLKYYWYKNPLPYQ